MKFVVNQPTSLDEISLAQYQKFLIEEEKLDGHFLDQVMLSLFLGMELSEVLMIRKTDTDELIQAIADLFNQDSPLQKTFKIKDIEFGFIPNLEDITMGEFVDLDTYMGDWQQMHKAMAVLYRPVTKRYKDTYEIEPYNGTKDEMCELMKYAGMGVVQGATLFFYNLSKALISASQHSLQDELIQEITQQLNSLEKDGDGTHQSTLSQVKDLIELTKQHDTVL